MNAKRETSSRGWSPTSFLVTGFSSSERCTSRLKPLSGSRSANSAKLFCVSTIEETLGSDAGRVGWMCVRRLRARRSVCRRGERGKLESEDKELSVKSMQSWSCSTESVKNSDRRTHAAHSGSNLCDTHIFDGRNFVPYKSTHTLQSIELM